MQEHTLHCTLHCRSHYTTHYIAHYITHYITYHTTQYITHYITHFFTHYITHYIFPIINLCILSFFPLQTVLRVWDALFYEGSKILFRVGVSLVTMHRAHILQARTFPDIVEVFKKITSDRIALNCHEFMEVREKGYIVESGDAGFYKVK